MPVAVHGFQNDHSSCDPFAERLDLSRFRVDSCSTSSGAGRAVVPSSWERRTIGEYVARRERDRVTSSGCAPPPSGTASVGRPCSMRRSTHPERFSAVVLAAPVSSSGLDFLPDEAAFEALAHPTPEQQRALDGAAFRYPLADDDLAELLAVVALRPGAHRGRCPVDARLQRQDELHTLAVRTLLVCGDRDRHVPLRNHLATQQRIPRCGLQVYFDVATCPSSRSPTASPPTSPGSWSSTRIASATMCGRFVSSSSPEKIAEYFGAAFEGETLGENYNVAPTNDIYAVVAGPDGKPRLEVFHWGLIPVWAKDAKIGPKMINARAETLAEKPAYKGVFKKPRCIIPMDGFYEWKAGEPGGPVTKAGKPAKQPMFIHRLDGEPLAVAGLWSAWRDKAEGPTPTGCTAPRSSPRRPTARWRRSTTACR